MTRTILLTGATDGIGRATAHALVSAGHRVLLHGRSADKLARVEAELAHLPGQTETFRADLSRLSEVDALADAIHARDGQLDVLINNAGIFRTAHTRAEDGRDIRWVVNTVAPYRLTQRLLELLGPSGRVVNLSSAAQSPIDYDAMMGRTHAADFSAYAQSKLAITAWSRALGQALGADGPMVVSVNPGSMLGSKMVKDAFGVAGRDLNVGAHILVRAALSDEFASATGMYFDNDAGQFGPPHPHVLDARRTARLMEVLDGSSVG